ncbi:MAG: glycosyltransferase family 4 protein [Nitrospiraceae bacterium]|nr:glycosyltransferase family 4 protein [Nitrospiraceae bacterium]
MKVLVLTNMYPRCMGGTFVHEQAKHLINAGCELRVIAPAAFYPKALANGSRWSTYAKIPARAMIDTIPVYYPRYLRLPGKWFHAPACYTQYLGLRNTADAIIRKFRPDLIHAHGATPAGYIGLMLKKRYGLPLVCSLRGSDINLYPGYGRLSFHMTQRVIAESDGLVSVSAALRDAANSVARAKTKNEIRIVHNGCDRDSFAGRPEDRRATRAKLGIPGTARVLAFVGSISRDKGICELMESFRRIHSLDAGVHLLVAGDGPEAAILEAMASHNLSANLHRLGGLSHGAIPAVLSAADVLVLPSYHEGLPNAVLEAMACRLPVIATRVGGIPEAVEDGASGLLVPPGDAETLTGKIRYLLLNDDVARRMGDRGREIVQAKFTWRANAEKVLGLYGEVMNAK